MGKVLRNRTLNKYLTLFNKERVILLYTFANVMKMKCIILILNGYRYYGVILVFITIWYSYYFISLLRKRYWDTANPVKATPALDFISLLRKRYWDKFFFITVWFLVLHQSTAKAVLRHVEYCYGQSKHQGLHQSTAKAVLRHNFFFIMCDF